MSEVGSDPGGFIDWEAVNPSADENTGQEITTPEELLRIAEEQTKDKEE
jgi:hypothetical protein